MKLIHAATIALTVTGIAAGCSKQDTAAACIAKLDSFKPSAPAAEKQGIAAACKAVSPKAQACLAAVKTEKEMDGCISDKAEKDAFFSAALAASMGKEHKKS